MRRIQQKSPHFGDRAGALNGGKKPTHPSELSYSHCFYCISCCKPLPVWCFLHPACSTCGPHSCQSTAGVHVTTSFLSLFSCMWKRGLRETRLPAPACGRLFDLPKSWSINGKGNMFHLRKIQMRCQAQVFSVAPRGIHSCLLNPSHSTFVQDIRQEGAGLLLTSPSFLALFLFQERVCLPACWGNTRCPPRGHFVVHIVTT